MIKVSHVTAGFIAVLVGYTSSVAVVLQAAQSIGISTEQLHSWLLVLGLGMGVLCITFSLRYKQPILAAWSTPGAALLVAHQGGMSIEAATGAFVFSSALTLLVGLTGWFEKAMDRLPVSLGAAMLAGVLLPFALNIFFSFESQPVLVAVMMGVWLAGRFMWPRYNIPLVLLAGVVFSVASGLSDLSTLQPQFAMPVWVTPSFEWGVMLGVGLPLFVVNMASQNLPGIAAFRLAGYTPPISPLISGIGVVNGVLAPFGGYAFNLAAITASICAGEEAGEDKEQRYKASVVAGVLYLIMGLFGATVVALFALFPEELVFTIAGLALVGTIANSLHAALGEASTRDAALMTFLVTFSGFSPLGIGAPFWGLVLGGGMMWLSKFASVKR